MKILNIDVSNHVATNCKDKWMDVKKNTFLECVRLPDFYQQIMRTVYCVKSIIFSIIIITNEKLSRYRLS